MVCLLRFSRVAMFFRRWSATISFATCNSRGDNRSTQPICSQSFAEKSARPGFRGSASRLYALPFRPFFFRKPFGRLVFRLTGFCFFGTFSWSRFRG
jgi:hypothetical protein